MDITVIIVTILSATSTLLTSIVGYFVVRLIRLNDEAQKTNAEVQKSNVAYQVSTTKEINEIKFNYLDRFERVKDQIIESERKIINNIAGQFRHKIDND